MVLRVKLLQRVATCDRCSSGNCYIHQCDSNVNFDMRTSARTSRGFTVSWLVCRITWNSEQQRRRRGQRRGATGGLAAARARWPCETHALGTQPRHEHVTSSSRHEYELLQPSLSALIGSVARMSQRQSVVAAERETSCKTAPSHTSHLTTHLTHHGLWRGRVCAAVCTRGVCLQDPAKDVRRWAQVSASSCSVVPLC